MLSMSNPTGKHRAKRRHHGEGSVCRRTDHWRARPWVAIVPYVDASGRRREMWLSAASREEADDIRKRELRRLGKGLVVSEQTVGEYVTAWLADVDVGPGTLPRYEAHVRERIAPSLGGLPLAKLTPQHVRAAVPRWKGAPQTRGGALRLLRAAMRQAVADRLIEHDPTAGIPYPKVPRHEPVTLTAAEARHLMATVKGERFAPILVVSLGLGIRRGEALGLRTRDVKWETDDGREASSRNAGGLLRPVGHGRDHRIHAHVSPGLVDDLDRRSKTGAEDSVVDTAGGSSTSTDANHDRDGIGRSVHDVAWRPASVTIAKSLRYIPPPLRAEGEGPYRLTGTKTGETREIPLPAFVADALAASIAERDAELRAAKVHAANDFVFSDPAGNPVPLQSLYEWFKGDKDDRSKSALARAGLPDMRWHDLRASTITLLLDMGVDLVTIQRIVGHRDLATTRRYVGKTPTAMTAAATRLDEAMG